MIYSLRTISVLKIFQLWYLPPSLKRRGGEKRGTNFSTGSAFRSRNPDLSNLLASRESSLVLYARYISTTYNACPPTLWHLRERGGCAHARAGSSCGTVYYAARIIPVCTETNWTATREREWCAWKEGNDKATAWAERLVEGDYKQHGVRVSNSRDASKSGFKLIFAGNTPLLSFFLSSPLCVHRMLPVFFFFCKLKSPFLSVSPRRGIRYTGISPRDRLENKIDLFFFFFFLFSLSFSLFT